MAIYIVIATFIYIGIFIPFKLKDIHYKISILFLFIFTAFRDINLGGTDAASYQGFFYYKIPVLDNFLNYDHEFAYGYAFLNSVIKTIIVDYRFYQIIYSIISILLLYYLIKRIQFDKAERSLFLFVYFCYRFLWNNFVLLRQNIAVMVFWFILIVSFDKRIKSYLGILFSWLWHKSALINLLILPILKLSTKVKRRKMLIITFLLSVIFLLFSKITFRYLGKIFVYFAGARFNRYLIISSTEHGINLFNYVLRWVLLILFYINYETIKNKYKDIFLYSSFLVVIISSINIGFVGRMVEYFMLGIYSIIPLLLGTFKSKDKLIYLIGIYYLFIIILVRFLVTFSEGQLLNYKTMFN